MSGGCDDAYNRNSMGLRQLLLWRAILSLGGTGPGGPQPQGAASGSTSSLHSNTSGSLGAMHFSLVEFKPMAMRDISSSVQRSLLVAFYIRTFKL